MRHADYEIYTFKCNGVVYYAFDIEYFGHYVAKSKEEILLKLDAARKRVQLKLEEIEEANKEYYHRLEVKQQMLKDFLSDYHKSRRPVLYQEAANKRLQARTIKKIKTMLKEGFAADEIAQILSVSIFTVYAISKKSIDK